MTLVTRCPGCHAIFRLTGGQLHSHNGDVRCGQCKQVFNGFTALIAVPVACIQPLVMLPQPDLDQSDPDNAAVMSVAETPPPVDYFDIQPSAPKISRLWLVPNAVLLVLLLGQIMHAYRTEIFIAFPAFRPVLNEYCTLMQCEVDLPRHLHLLSLESSDLRVSSSADPDVVELSAIIRNHAPFPQALPALLLTLTDADEKLLASRIFTAKDYLDSAADQSIFAGESEIQVQCFLNTNQLNAMGYKLELFYP
ncbi:zinc-ribbon and DUF3426 domain-containing protein [Nitrosomonas eutropha]|uniref:Zn finger-like uncharacterized protein n=2 Tax=Nitrosomonas eutropha TaxID=916 RepID=A0ABX5M4U4_9PROT|nr:zinc-ribbon and DUF3426 domain-containing protein [Nitrosomonas eutropha]ABI60129.1 MJ0042 family finger-like protein [Nitrosomonas eutropha C91]PXV77551.1 putative Zn finger-like uncharacterized protein [Nitrosomonas eutropha]